MPRLMKLVESDRAMTAARIKELKRLRPRLAPELRLLLDDYIDCLADTLAHSKVVLATRSGSVFDSNDVIR